MNRIQEAIEVRNVRVLLIAGIMLAFFLIKCFFSQGYFPKPNEQAWHIGTSPASSRRFGQCDATDDRLFFSYWGKISQVDAYDHEGTFLYSLEFQDLSNGQVYIRCRENMLYIKLRNNNVFVFQGSDMISGLTEDQADAQGLTDDWFREGRSLCFQDSGLYYQGGQGNLIPVTVPEQITLPLYLLDFSPDINRLVVSICAILFFSFFAYHIFKK